MLTGSPLIFLLQGKIEEMLSWNAVKDTLSFEKDGLKRFSVKVSTKLRVFSMEYELPTLIYIYNSHFKY